MGLVVMLAVLVGTLSDYAWTQKRIADERATSVESFERFAERAVATQGQDVVFLGPGLRVDREAALERSWHERRMWYVAGLGLVALLTATAVVAPRPLR